MIMACVIKKTSLDINILYTESNDYAGVVLSRWEAHSSLFFFFLALTGGNYPSPELFGSLKQISMIPNLGKHR